MKRCPKCGAVNPRPGQKFCGSCGAPLSDTPPQAPHKAPPSWPPEKAVQRNQVLMVAVVAVVLVLVVAAGVMLFARHNAAEPVDAEAPVTTVETAEGSYTVPEDRRLYLTNLDAVDGMKLTADGVEIEYGIDAEGKPYIDRSLLTGDDVLLRAIVPIDKGYRTALALVSKPSNPEAGFGSLTVCDADGFNQPDEEYIDAMLTVYYRSQLRAFNSRNVSDLRFSTDLNDQSWEGDITMGAYDAVVYDLDASDMTFTTKGLAYGDNKVTLNAAGQWVGTNRESGAQESGTDYMTIQAIWRDGIWQIDRCLPCTEQEYNDGTLKLSTH